MPDILDELREADKRQNGGLLYPRAITEIERLRALLEPFAKGASEIPKNWPDTRALLIDEKHPDNPKKHCLLIAYVKDFRAARAALAK